MTNMIYADHAATTPMDPDAYEAMLPYLRERFANPSNQYSISRNPRKALSTARELIAECINASADEIYFTSGGTEADNWAIKGVALKYCCGKHIITSCFEHHAVLNSCAFLEELGFRTTYLPVRKSGHIEVPLFKESILPQTILVSIMMANNEIGTVQDIKSLAEIAHRNSTLFHCDAVQAVGHIPVDVKELNIDLLSASAHKFNGPKGVGFLYIKRGTELTNLLSGGKQENHCRAGTENVAGIVGMAVALKKNVVDINKNSDHLNNLSKTFMAVISSANIDYIVNGDNDRLPGFINISIRNQDGEALMHRLDLNDIIVSTGSACTSGLITTSHVIASIGISPEYAQGTIRITFGKDNSIADAIRVAEVIISMVSV